LDDPFQFTLGRLLLLTGAVALCLGAARAIRDSSLSESRLEGLYELVVLSVVCSLTAIAALAALWAMLGVGRPRARLPLAIGLAAAVGLLPAYCFDRPLAAYVILAAVASLLSILTAASLYVLRQAGYRLTRRDQRAGNHAYEVTKRSNETEHAT
jgi:hypothetical protein